jgi:NAD+ synthase
MMRDYKKEMEERVTFLREVLKRSGTKGFVYGNSGGKDSALAGILCKKACGNTLGVLMPCGSKRNYGEDLQDGLAVAAQFGIETVTVDLTSAKDALRSGLETAGQLTEMAQINLAPRLRMTALYALAQSRGALVAGTGNRSEAYVGYFTKWGDGAYDVNPIADLTVTEIYEFLEFLGAPERIIQKAPSAGLAEGQTDEQELGFSYAALDRYLLFGEAAPALCAEFERRHAQTEHKRRPALQYPGKRGQEESGR